MFCCHRLFGLESFSLNVVSFFFPKFLYGTFGKDIGVSSLSRFTEYDFIISPRSQGRAGRQAFLLEVPWSAYHSYDFAKSFLIIERVLGRWGQAPWNSRYPMLCQILPLCFGTKDAVFWDTVFSALFTVDECPQATNSTADVHGSVSPCGFSNSLRSWQESSWAWKHRFSVRLY